ncbi:hypothetical protein P168DRAFT_286021 [Aspergillus campestris IBT 28561]|uniref:Myb-like domain-containing protein n=1 Tax=Aspergillus campestris (strain IBT 28561) TaxID=1392248 RepID=A0A2I1DD83_ASPC2|nr:uncharacterized protein P168DRAFT_286021 [Aspergillus campestris IBT 28561]PKY07837.1 hypothetical protein P168DRAFT_286021 [Aspergillus campestris IBT 28561]
MDSTGTYAKALDESQVRELPQLQSFRIAPLRQPVSSRVLSVPSPLEPDASGAREPSAIPKTSNSSGALPSRNNDPSGGGAPESSNVARTTKKPGDASADPQPSLEPPPKPILPAFVNLRALERFPYSSFDDDTHARKRRRLGIHADSFGEHLQLPIPQAQKEQRPPPFGPFAILNGLNEPPPNAALLPPIEAGSISQLLSKPSRDASAVEPLLLAADSSSESLVESAAASQNGEKREGRIEEILDSPVVAREEPDGENLRAPEPSHTGPGTVDAGADEPVEAPAQGSTAPLSPKSRGRSRKNVRKWTEEETTALLRGVVKCGIGNWTAILAQPELNFNKRSASNLKDRFRVCCPWAYRAQDPNEATKKLRDTLADALSRAETEASDGIAGKIRLPAPWPADSDPPVGGTTSASPDDPPSPTAEVTPKDPAPQSTSKSSPKSTPTLSSRSKSTLESLGIPEPHFTMKSRRRSRRPFTTAEDEALLKGYAVHGFQWTLIQQDTRLNLGHRRATDLRDRFRTKFPHAYRDGGSASGKTLPGPSKVSPNLQDSADKSPPPSLPPLNNNLNLNPTPKPTPITTNPKPKPKPKTRRKKKTKKATLSNPNPSTPHYHPRPTTQSPGNLNPSNGASGVVDGSWTDNTLAPMTWDELA